MRQLHPVGWREHFVAGGLYAHRLNGQPTGETQQWTQHRLPDDALLTRVDWQRPKRAEFVLIEAWRASAAAPIERFDLHLYAPHAPTVRAAYHVFPDRLDYHLNRDDDSLSESLPLSAGTRIDPGAAIFGGVYAALTPNPSPGGRGESDSVRDSSSISGTYEFPDGILWVVTIDSVTGHPFLDKSSVRQIGAESVTIGSETLAARVYNVEWTRGGASILWLDEHELPLRLERGADTIDLTQLVRAPETPTR